MRLRTHSARGALLLGLLAALSTAAPAVRADEPTLPVVFVHGFSGSAQQYETQALRWASNDYPNVVTGIDRLFIGFSDEDLDAFIDDVLAETGDSQVYAIGHSAGTAVMTGYLNSGDPDRVARVAKYIGIDGASNEVCPGGVDENGDPNVPCMGVWARGPTTRMVGPDHNVYFSELGHTQSVTAPESFAAQYEFLTGQPPETTLILPERPDRVEIAGRALNFPYNTGIEGAHLELWEVNPLTGERTRSMPEEEVTVDASGNFGPWAVNGARRYEINVIRETEEPPDSQQHFYFEPFLRSNYLLRLNISPLGSTLSETIRENAGPNTGASISRQKEWWGDNPVDPTNVDVLDIKTTIPVHSTYWVGRVVCLLLGDFLTNYCDVEHVGDIATPGTAPYSASTIAMITFDVEGDGVSHPEELVSLGPFLSGIDTYMPAPDADPNGVVTFHLNARREPRDQVINTPNWPMEGGHYMSVIFREWTQDVDNWPHCKLVGLCH
jgi:pimeloyl-ACP methyl ester carboxylesterase